MISLPDGLPGFDLATVVKYAIVRLKKSSHPD